MLCIINRKDSQERVHVDINLYKNINLLDYTFLFVSSLHRILAITIF